MFWGFFALQLTDRVLAPNLAFSEGTMVLWQEKKERKREREIRGGRLMGSVEVREEERRGEEGWDGKATHNLEFTANVLRPIWAKFVSDPALNYKIPTSLYLPPPSPPPPPFLPPLPILFFFFWVTPLFFIQPHVFVLLLDVHSALPSPSLSSSPPVSSSLWEWDSCPTMKLWKREHPPRGAGCQRAK